jgi:hypothetical protein
MNTSHKVTYDDQHPLLMTSKSVGTTYLFEANVYIVIQKRKLSVFPFRKSVVTLLKT